MPRKPRLIPDDALVEITTRTVGARCLMRPSARLNWLILGILGRAMHLYPITVYAFAFLSNHYHLLARAADGKALSAFLKYLNSQVAKAIQSETGWDHRVWQRRADVIEVIDDDAATDRLRYILAQGAKEGLVASPLDWPGITCARALAGTETLVGVWRNNTLASRARKRGRTPLACEVERSYPIELAPIPGWAHLTLEARQAKVNEMLAEITRAAKLQHPIPLGRDKVLSVDPTWAPPNPKRAPAPPVHASTLRARIDFCVARAAKLHEYRQRSIELREGKDVWITGPAFVPGLFVRDVPATYIGFTPPTRT